MKERQFLLQYLYYSRFSLFVDRFIRIFWVTSMDGTAIFNARHCEQMNKRLQWRFFGFSLSLSLRILLIEILIYQIYLTDGQKRNHDSAIAHWKLLAPICLPCSMWSLRRKGKHIHQTSTTENERENGIKGIQKVIFLVNATSFDFRLLLSLWLTVSIKPVTICYCI